MQENDFTKDVLIPLLVRLGYCRAEFRGGSSERGKDVIAFREDAFGTLEPSVFVVKRLTKSTAANKRESFHTSVTQMEQASESKIPFVDGTERHPAEVCFVTPHSVSTQMLESRFSEAVRIRANRCKYIDGDKIADLCAEHFPQLFQAVLGSTVSIREALSKLYTNEAVLKSLGADCMVSVDTFHVGLDCAIGSRTLRQLTATNYKEIKPKVVFLQKENTEITSLLKMLKIPLKKASEKDEELAPQVYINQKDQRKALAHRESQLSKRLTELKSLGQVVLESSKRQRIILEYLREVIVARESENLSAPVDGVRLDDVTRPYADMKLSDLKTEKRKVAFELQMLQKFPERSKELELLPLDLDRVESLTAYGSRLGLFLPEGNEAKPIFHDIINLRRDIEQTAHTLGLENAIESTGTTEKLCVVDTKNILNRIALFQNSLARIFNCKTWDSQKPPKGFSATGGVAVKLGMLVDFLLRYDAIEEIEIANLADVAINLQHLLRSNSLILLGEAGSGKSTSLQAYAQETARASGGNRFVVYAPLGRLVRIADSPLRSSEQVVQTLAKYLRDLGVDIPVYDLNKMLSSDGSVLVLDAIDEAYSADASVLDGIASIKERFRALQLLVSSREFAGPLCVVKASCSEFKAL